MKWAIDRIEDDIVIIENIETKEKREVATELLPSSIYEGSILIYQDNEYKLDSDEETLRRQMILEKFNKLRNND